MRARRLGATAAGVALSLALSGCGVFGGGGGEPEIAADVAGTPITSARVNELFSIFANTSSGAAGLEGGESGIKVSPEQIRATALSFQIKVTFLEVLAEREGITVPEQIDEEVFEDFAGITSLQSQGFRGEDLKIAARAEAIGKAIAAKLLPEVTVTDEDVQAAYDERKDIVGESFRATTDIAFMDSETSAAKLKADLEDGKKFLDATAAAGSATLVAETIDITPLSPVQPDVLDAVRTLDAGKTAEPIRYDVGDGPLFVVLHQQKRTDLPALSVEEARPELEDIVTNRKRKDVYDQWLKQQYTAANITVDDYYGKWESSFQAVI